MWTAARKGAAPVVDTNAAPVNRPGHKEPKQLWMLCF